MNKLMLYIALMLVSSGVLAQRIVGLEYWFDAVYSSKQTKTVSAGGQTASILESFECAALSTGFHSMSVRFLDNNNKWSAVSDHIFFKAGVSASASQNIVAMEYWFDGQYASKLSKTLSPFNGSVIETLDLPAIANGIHRISIRFQDNNSLWSTVDDFFFFKAGSTADTEVLITKYRYWFDSDTKNIIEVSLPTPANTINLQKFIDLKTPSPDVYPLVFNMQFLDNTGIWSAVYTKYFLPEPSFESFRYLSTYSFRNTSSFSRKFLWNFGDGKTDTVANPTHIYTLPGVYTVTLTATNSLGTQDTFDVLEVRGLREVVANKAGNTGDASILVYGAGFSRDAKVWLEGPTLINADTSYIERLDAVYARFDLRGKPVGVYDVAVQFPGDSVMKLLKSFSIEAGQKPQPFVSIEGRNRILFGRWQSYQMNIGNTANVDATGVPLILVISKADGLSLDFKGLTLAMSPPSLAKGLGYILDSVPNRFEIDELFGQPFSGYVYVFYIPSIAANSNRTMELRIKTNQSFKLLSWMNEPYFQSPFDDAVASCINEAIAWYALEKGADLGLKLIPGAGCLKNIGKESYGMMSRVIERKIGKDENGKKYKGWSDWAWGWGNWVADMTAIGVGCAMDVFPPTKAAKFAYATYKTIIELNKIKKDVRKLASADAKCREKFAHLSKKDQSVSAVSSFDPNELVGPSGFTSQRYTHNQGKFDYTIFFENKSTATAPAQEVVVLDTLDKTKFDLSTFSFGAFSFGGNTHHPLSGLQRFTVNIDSVRNGKELLRVNASLDTSTGIITWQFITLNPATMDYPDDPDAGFLPPNKTSPEGEGFVSFSVRVRSTVPEDVAIVNRAKINFDLNEPIFTNTYSNKLDVTAPTSKLTGIFSTQLKNYYRFTMESQDALSGVKYYTIYGSRNDSAYTPLFITHENPFYYLCDDGVVYRFYSVATDSVGNEEAAKTKAEQSTLAVSVHDEGAASIIDNILLYPNPAQSVLTIEYTAEREGMLNIRVIDAFGRCVITPLSEFSETGTNRKSVNIEAVPSGLYFVSIKTKTDSFTRKIMIER